jgi:hypothetical protein
MCQVTPFTYPCCKRIYVLVEKLPNCPTDWPRRKCPQELCIQVIDVETAQVKRSSSGICWRCKAAADGKTGPERENMRPEIDRAAVVEGLEELDVAERRQRSEAGGNCWFCGAKHGCSSCGQKNHPAATEVPSPSPQSKRRQIGDTGLPRKRVRVERGGNMVQMRSPFQSQPLFAGYSQPTFRPLGQIPAASPYLSTPNPARGGFPAFPDDTLAQLSSISEGMAGTWQGGYPSTGYTAFWESLNSIQGRSSAAIESSQRTEDIRSNTDGDPHPPGAGIVLDPGDASGHNQVSSAPSKYCSRHIMTIIR